MSRQLWKTFSLFVGFVCLTAEGSDSKDDLARQHWEALHQALIGDTRTPASSFIGQSITAACFRAVSKPELLLSVEKVGEPKITIKLAPAKAHSHAAVEIRQIENFPAPALEIDLSGTVLGVDWEKREIVVEISSFKLRASM